MGEVEKTTVKQPLGAAPAKPEQPSPLVFTHRHTSGNLDKAQLTVRNDARPRQASYTRNPNPAHGDVMEYCMCIKGDYAIATGPESYNACGGTGPAEPISTR